MKRFFIFWGFAFVLGLNLDAQGEIDQQNKIFYRNENSLCFSLNSTGWGFNGRHAKRVNAAKKIIYDIDFAILKHPQELRLPNGYSSAAGSFVYGKTNIVMDFRFGYGKQKEIFRKFDIGGVSIRHFHSYGISLALLKPVYYDFYFRNNEIKTLKFSNDSYNNSIGIDRATFFRGFDELKPIPGVFLKLGICFEYGQSDKTIHAIEGGIIFDGFIKKLEMMSTKNNYWFFNSLFVSYRFGKVYDPSEKKAKKKKKEDYYY